MRNPPWRLWLPALVLLASNVEAAPGDLDPTFGTGGIVSTAVGTPAAGRAAVLQPDGSLVVAGVSNGAFLLLRYTPDGSLDPDFGNNGIVTTTIGTNASATGLVLQSDGKLVAAGTSTSSGQAAFALARYDDDGTLDASFGSGGIVTTPLAGAAVYALGLQTDGKLVAAGTSTDGDGGAITLVRYEADGDLDAAFGTAGVVRTSLGANADVAYALVVQPDQKLVVGGRDSSGGFMFARYDPGGILDPTFGAGGVSITPALTAVCRAMAIQPDGKIVGIGTGGFNNYFVAVVVRVAADGTLDSTFLTNAPEFFPSGGVRMYASAFGQNYQIPRAVTVDPAGRIVLAGVYGVNALPGVPHVMYIDSLYAARLNADGTEDATFPRRSWPAAPGEANALLLQADHKAVAVGTDTRVAAVRFLTGLCGDGVVDDGETCDDANGINGDGCDANCTTTACGNRIVTAGERCDDGNVTAGDCCDAVCAFESAGSTCPDDGNVCRDDVCDGAGRCTRPANSNPCDDGNACTVGDTCVDGACQGSSTTECPICESCTGDGGCVAAPRPACTEASASRVSRLKIKDKTQNKSDQMQWQWLHGGATVAGFGDPLGNDDYALCVYDQSGATPTLAFRARIPAGGPCGNATCWRSNAKGFNYKNKSRTPDGVQSVTLKAGTGNAQIRVLAAGALLSGRPSGLPAPPLAVPLVVQLQAESGACWEATFSAPSTNEAGRFDGKSD